MKLDSEEWRKLRSQFIEAAANFENEGYRTFIERTARSEEYHATDRYERVAEIKWPYRPWRTCWILAPSSGTNEQPFAVMKSLFTKAWLRLPIVVAGRIVDTAVWQLSPRDDVGLLWARSHYELWCWLLWFDWLWRCREVETEEPEFPPAGMDLQPFSSSVSLIGRWGLDGGDGTLPEWLAPKLENPIETDDNFDAALAREQLRPYIENHAFRQYVKEQITLWERWHFSHTEQINEYEGRRDNSHQELKELQGRDRHSDDPADFDPLGHAATCYENYRDIAAGLKDNPEYKLVADREPVLFKEASVAAIVALFWCDINHRTLLVPEYDFLEEGPFIEYLREQWEKPMQGRYKRIVWFVEKAIKVFKNTIAKNGVVEPEEPEQEGQSDRSKSLSEAALKAVIDGGLAGVLAAASKVDAVTKHSETMMAMLKTDDKYYGWSADDWVTHLEAAKGTILATDAWGHIKAWRSENKAKRKAN